MDAVSFALQAFAILPGLIRSGKDVYKFITDTEAALKTMQAENRNPTDAEWTALNAKISELQKDLHDS